MYYIIFIQINKQYINYELPSAIGLPLLKNTYYDRVT